MDGFRVIGEQTWAMPELTGVGRVMMCSPLVAFPDSERARIGDSDSLPWRRSLNGRWWFTIVDHPDQVPPRFAEPDLDPSSGDWTPAVVPGSWSDAGSLTAEGLPAHNPTGVYRAAVSIPPEWKGRRVVLHVGGAESVLYAYVNGAAVGMGKDSHLPNEFDVTHLVRDGANTITLMVVRFSDGSAIEDQKFSFGGGITGEVFCYSTGPTFVADVHVVAGLDHQDLPVGTLGVVTTVGYPGDVGLDPGWRVEVDIESLDGQSLVEAPFVVEVPQRTSVEGSLADGRSAVEIATRIPGVSGWTAEDPVCYRVLVSLVDPDDEVVEVSAQHVGFRTVEVEAGELRINGVPVTIRGVVYHDREVRQPDSSVDAEMRVELAMMKRFNINAVRFIGHPPDVRMLDLCDELGLYVFVDANLDVTSSTRSGAGDPRYTGAVVERGARMVQRDKNHPSVIAWFAGTGGDSPSWNGMSANRSAMVGWMRSCDPARVIAAEETGACSTTSKVDDLNHVRRSHLIGDLWCPVFVSVDELLDRLRRGDDADRPVLQGRYSASSGNANGGLSDWFSAFGANHEFTGGFLWSWQDLVDHPGVGGNPVALPALFEHRYLAAPVSVTASDHDLRRRKVRISNRQSFRDLSSLTTVWELALDGAILATGDTELPDIGPGETAVVELPYERPETVVDGSTLTVALRFSTTEPEVWTEAGHEVAWYQFVVPMPAKAVAPRPRIGPERTIEISRDHAGGRARVSVGKLVTELDEATGDVASMRWAGQDLLVSSPRVDLWRAPTDNDRSIPIGGSSSAAERWASWGLDRLHRAPVSANLRVDNDGVITLVSRHKMWGRDSGLVMTCRQKVTVMASGDLVFEHEIGVPDEVGDLARVGVSFSVAGELEKLQWVGRGPGETYPDRCAGATLGRWHTTVTDTFVPYEVPQEHGSHVDTRWFALTRLGDASGRYGTTGAGLFVGAVDPDPFVFSASHHTAADLAEAASRSDLAPRPEVIVHVDAAHRGLGTAATGHDTAETYRPGAGTWKWSWRIRAFDPLVEDPAAIGTQVLG